MAKSKVKPNPPRRAEAAQATATPASGAIDCRDANAATEAYRAARDAGAGSVEFDRVWASHPTWQTALADGLWHVRDAPPEEPPGGYGMLVRVAALD